MSKRYHCPSCGWTPAPHEPDGDWAHCPNCLCSIHGEDAQGFFCGGALEPVSIWVKDGGWEIVQRCRVCGAFAATPLHADDSPFKALEIAARPLSSPPFPVEKLEQLARITGESGDVGGYYLDERE